VTVVFVVAPVIVAAWALEGRPPWQLMDPAKQSWSFMLELGLAALLGVCAHGWRGLQPSVRARYHKKRWLALCIVLGTGMAMLFHIHEESAYDLLRYYSIPKLIHDLVTYVVMATMVIYAAWPVLRHGSRKVPQRRVNLPVRSTVAVLLALWVAAAVHDAVRPPNPAFLHVKHPSVAELGQPTPARDPLAASACKTPPR
jgi:hypothetical protein